MGIELGATKRRKVRTVDFCDTLADILRKAKTEQHKNRFKYGELYHLNYYKEVKEKTILTMKSTVCREPMKCQMRTKKIVSLVSAHKGKNKGKYIRNEY